MFKKHKRTGVVVNTDDFGEYLKRREGVKETMRTKQELKDAKNNLANMHIELAEVKTMLQQILEKKL